MDVCISMCYKVVGRQVGIYSDAHGALAMCVICMSLDESDENVLNP